MPDQASPTTPAGSFTPEEISELIARITREVPQVQTLTLTPGQAGQLVINLVRIHKTDRRKGHGNRVFDLLTEWADQRGVVLTLTADPTPLPGERRIRTQRLRDWYFTRGFQFNIGRHARHEYSEGMYRVPRSTPS